MGCVRSLILAFQSVAVCTVLTFVSYSYLYFLVDGIYDDDANATSMQGSIFWMAPEVLHNDKRGYNAKIDIWSLGCLVLEMWAGRRPWNQEDMYAVMFKVSQ